MQPEHEDDYQANAMPSPEEIARICREEIQPGWTPQVRNHRSGKPVTAEPLGVTRIPSDRDGRVVRNHIG